MKGRISLKDFIQEVKTELRQAVDDTDPFFIMGDVELEVSFELAIEGEAKAKLFVLDAGVKTQGKQIHTARIKLTPFVEKEAKPAAKTVSPSVPAGRAVPVPASRPVHGRAPAAPGDIRRPTANGGGAKTLATKKTNGAAARGKS